MNKRPMQQCALQGCHARFTPYTTMQRFCSPKHRATARQECQTRIGPIVVLHFECDICRSSGAKRFSLKRAVRGDGDRRATTRGVGTIFLCGRCWAKTAARRRRWFGPRRIIEAAA